MSKNFVAVMLGSDSDLKVMQSTLDTLDSLGIHWELRILSAHRTPDEVRQYLEDSAARGCAVYIAAAGLAAHLAGAVAAHTLKPVIGVPLDAGSLGGMDALLATVQMPGGVPVACVAIGSAGAKNAAFLAARILALSDENTAAALVNYRDTNRASVLAKNENLPQAGGS
ncbi:MAG: 5-(carboxyamino)imidazole ribonucleotide mutase [Gammaproteobacteria bacterium]|nr:5-(carboxyamino)imidazole ribonucleotide mutase [Gammaproteobacteria bacterium]